MTDAEFEALAADLQKIVDPELVSLVEVHGQTIGFALSVPDYYSAIDAL